MSPSQGQVLLEAPIHRVLARISPSASGSRAKSRKGPPRQAAARFPELRQWVSGSAQLVPGQNCFVESCNGKLRDELLNRKWSRPLAEPKVPIEVWRQFCNERRPHRALGCRSRAAVRLDQTDTDSSIPKPTA